MRGARQTRRAMGEEGMAMLLVLMLIVMVSAAGVFAAQSTALEVRSAGYLRQAGQTHYVAESGLVAAIDEMRSNCQGYLGIMRANAATAATPPGLAAPPLSYRFYYDDFTTRVVTPGGLFQPPTSGAGGLRVEGSLGTGLLQPGFVTTVTIIGDSLNPQVGFPAGGSLGPRVQMLTMEFASDGRTQLQGVSDLRNNAVGIESARAIAQVPCL